MVNETGTGKPESIGALRARQADLDPIHASPYRPAARELPLHEAGHTKAPDQMHEPRDDPRIQRGVHTRLTAISTKAVFQQPAKPE
jgi:hypothetical protein